MLLDAVFFSKIYYYYFRHYFIQIELKKKEKESILILEIYDDDMDRGAWQKTNSNDHKGKQFLFFAFILLCVSFVCCVFRVHWINPFYLFLAHFF